MNVEEGSLELEDLRRWRFRGDGGRCGEGEQKDTVERQILDIREID